MEKFYGDPLEGRFEAAFRRRILLLYRFQRSFGILLKESPLFAGYWKQNTIQRFDVPRDNPNRDTTDINFISPRTFRRAAATTPLGLFLNLAIYASPRSPPPSPRRPIV